MSVLKLFYRQEKESEKDAYLISKLNNLSIKQHYNRKFSWLLFGNNVRKWVWNLG